MLCSHCDPGRQFQFVCAPRSIGEKARLGQPSLRVRTAPLLLGWASIEYSAETVALVGQAQSSNGQGMVPFTSTRMLVHPQSDKLTDGPWRD